MPDSSASKELFGLDLELWIACAAFLGPIVAALVGVVIYRYRQQVEEVEKTILRDGLQSFHTSLAGLLAAHLINFQIATYIIRYLKEYRIGELLTPAVPCFPEFVGVNIQTLPILPLLPVQDLIGDKVILDWGVIAISDTTLEARELDQEVRQPVLAYYCADPSKGKLNVEEAVERLQRVADAWSERVGVHFALLDRLYDLNKEVTRARPWLIRNYYTMRERAEIRAIRDELNKGFALAKDKRASVEPVMRSGGVEPPTSE